MATTDVAQKIISGNAICNGNIVTLCQGANFANFKDSNVENNTTENLGVVTAEDLETKYTSRWDDVRYYSGDSAS